MPNFIVDNTYHILDSSATALSWPGGGARFNLVVYATATNSAVDFLIAVGTPIFRFRNIIHGIGSSASIFQTTQIFDFTKVRMPTAWIPSTLTAASAWIHFV